MSSADTQRLTLLDVVMAVAEVTSDEREVSAVVAHMIRSGRLCRDGREG